MSEINVQIQQPQTIISVNNPEVTIELPTEVIEVSLLDAQTVHVQVQNPIIEVNMGCGCAGGSDAGGHIILDEGTPLTARPALNFIGAGVTVTDNPGDGTTDVTIPGGGGGGGSFTEVTVAELQALIDAAGLTPGGWYRITDAGGTDLGFVTHAVQEDAISDAGVGGFLNADFQAVGDYSGVEGATGIAAGTQRGIWRTSFEALTIQYVNLSGGTFAVGDTITGATTGATAVIVTDDGAGQMTAYMTSPGTALDGSEQLDNGAGVTADMNGVATGPDIQEGDLVIWELLHWQLTDVGAINGTNPADNLDAYTLLEKATANVGYIVAWDISNFSANDDELSFRRDAIGNSVFGNSSAIAEFPWGNEKCVEITVDGGAVGLMNYLGNFERCTIGNNAGIYDVTSVDGTCGVENLVLQSEVEISGIHLGKDAILGSSYFFAASRMTELVLGEGTLFEHNILEPNAFISGITTGVECTVSSNKVGQNATIGNGTTMYDGSTLNGNVLGSGAQLIGMTIGVDGGASCDFNQLAPDATMQNIGIGSGANVSRNVVGNDMSELVLGPGTGVFANKIEAGGQITGITAGENCTINGNEIGQGATLGSVILSDTSSLSNILLAPGTSFDSNELQSGATIQSFTLGQFSNYSNKTLDGVNLSGIEIGIDLSDTETLTVSYSGKKAERGFSNFDKQIDISGLTTLDCLAASTYIGLFSLTSTNATESIDAISNAPTAFPFVIRPEAGLALTITGTAYAGIAAGQIALKAASYTLDGDKGEYIVLEIDPLGSGALIEKQVVNGLL